MSIQNSELSIAETNDLPNGMMLAVLLPSDVEDMLATIGEELQHVLDVEMESHPPAHITVGRVWNPDTQVGEYSEIRDIAVRKIGGLARDVCIPPVSLNHVSVVRNVPVMRAGSERQQRAFMKLRDLFEKTGEGLYQPTYKKDDPSIVHSTLGRFKKAQEAAPSHAEIEAAFEQVRKNNRSGKALSLLAVREIAIELSLCDEVAPFTLGNPQRFL